MSNNSSISKLTFLLIDDHDMIIRGTIPTLEQAYPGARILPCKAAEEARARLKQISPDLIITDLSIPESSTTPSQSEVDNGIQLLRELLDSHIENNFVVQSAHIRALIRIKPSIDKHRGGFTVVDKRLPIQDMLIKVDWALHGVVYTPPEMRIKLEIKPQWSTVLRLAFQEGMQDKAIAQQMGIGERTVRHYWNKIQDALDIYPEEGKNTRIQTQLCAREKGLIN